MTQKKEFQVRSERIEQLAAKLEQAADPELHATAMELVQCVMELHGAGLERMMQVVSESDAAGSLTGKLLDDNLVSSLLLLHNLHPDDLADAGAPRLREGAPATRIALVPGGTCRDSGRRRQPAPAASMAEAVTRPPNTMAAAWKMPLPKPLPTRSESPSRT